MTGAASISTPTSKIFRHAPGNVRLLIGGGLPAAATGANVSNIADWAVFQGFCTICLPLCPDFLRFSAIFRTSALSATGLALFAKASALFFGVSALCSAATALFSPASALFPRPQRYFLRVPRCPPGCSRCFLLAGCYSPTGPANGSGVCAFLPCVSK